ncbi:hypothetical protein RF657_19185 [Yersinia rochesterensis]|uniref:hypothetical protein n=1 Tax=Yersinia rochesterensis TaxID=1604335 RepID=UPI0028535AD7|nr:hypothetical protein [Yersinia rochesterensis]MDR5020491.1 hypothetical protein [Yersinia rochesterensis]
MMDITKSREEFEKWANRLPSISITGRLERCGENYVDDYHTVFWLAWQAARESIVIDLPQKISEFNKMPDNGAILLEAVNYDEAIDDCAEALRTAGIRIKGESEKC